MNIARSRLIISGRIFVPSIQLLAELQAVRELRGGDDITRRYDAFLLDPGLGPPTYLTSDGRIVWDDDMWGVTGTRQEALAAVAAGIRKTGVLRLTELLPARPAASTDCLECVSTGRFDAHGRFLDVDGKPFSVVCGKCAGLGWTSPALVLTDSVLEAG